MKSSVSGAHEASISVLGPSPIHPTVTDARVTFAGEPPYGVETDNIYSALYIPVGQLCRTLKLLRTHGGQSQSRLAETSHLSQSTISDIEKGNLPIFANAYQVFKALGGKALYMLFTPSGIERGVETTPALALSPANFGVAVGRLFAERRKSYTQLTGEQRSQGAVAEILGVSASYISEFENGETVPRIDTVRRYFNVIGVDVALCGVEPSVLPNPNAAAIGQPALCAECQRPL